MSASGPGDQVRAAVQVAVPQAEAFRVFTEEIDRWWRRGVAYRVSGRRPGVLALEPRAGGRLFETFATESGERTVATGHVTVWEPPSRVVFVWRAVNFGPHEHTEVEVAFAPSGRGTLVTVTHRGWDAIRPDHPARHGLDVAPFLRMLGSWWGALLTSLREHAAGGDPRRGPLAGGGGDP